MIGSVAIGTLFAAADAAVTALPESRLRAMLDHAEGRNQALRRAAEDTTAVLARMLVGRVVCIVGAAVLTTNALVRVFPVYGPVLALAIVSLLYMTVTEVLTSIVRSRATELADLLLTIVRPFELAVMPLAIPLAWLGRAFTNPDQDGGVQSDPEVTARIAEAEVEYLIEKGQKDGVLGHAELLQAAVEFKGTRASEVMVPRTKMVAIALRTPLPRVLEMITAEGHSRYPVYDGRIDEVVGLLYVKDLFRVLREGKLESVSLDSLVRKPVLFVQEAQEVSTILKEMRQRRLHMALVLDEFGGTSGLLTLEDILELLVGEIRDELDDDEQVQHLGEGRLLVDAALSVEEVGTRLNVSFPESNAFVSIGGLVMEQLGKVPEAGTVVHVGDVDLVVRDADERRVRRIEVVVNRDRPRSDEGSGASAQEP